MSCRSLNRHLQRETQQSFKALVPYLRVQRAIELINTTSDDMASIGYAVGFQSPSSFNDAFKQWTGTPPGKYKHQKVSQ